jgi:hypothetical protein
MPQSIMAEKKQESVRGMARIYPVLPRALRDQVPFGGATLPYRTTPNFESRSG